MSHIPQPTGDGENLQTEFHSTQLQPNAPTLAPIETPTPNTREVQAAAGEEVTIPDYFYKQWRRVATLEWTTNDPIGKMLWSADVSPLTLDPALAWQMSLFHAWGGDFDIMVRAVGTGFHAGQMALVSVPPGIELGDINNPLDYTLYPYEVLDVKKLEPIAFPIRDRRNVKYHYMKRDSGPLTISDIGGKVAVFVDTPLTTSATGVQKISIAVWAKCASNFRVAYVRNPLTHLPKQEAYVPESLMSALNACNYIPLNNGVAQATQIVVQPVTTVKLTQYYSNMVDLDGNVVQKYNDGNFVQSYYHRVLSQVAGEFDGAGYFVPIRTGSGYIAETVSDDVVFAPNDGTSPASGKILGTRDSDLAIFTDIPMTSKSRGIMLFKSGNTDKLKWVFTRNNPTILKKGESFVLFGSRESKGMCTQTQNLGQLFTSHALEGLLPTNYCYLITVKSKLVNLPILHIKFHQAGYMTSNATTAFKQLLLDDIQFEQSGLIHVLDSFPEGGNSSANLATHLFLARQNEKQLKRDRKQLASVTVADANHKEWLQSSDHSLADSPVAGA